MTKHKQTTCPFTRLVPSYISRVQKPRILGMIIDVLKDSESSLSAEQISNNIKHRGYKYYPSSKTCAAMLGKHKKLFLELEPEKVISLGVLRNGWKVKMWKLRDDWNVDRKV